MLPWTFFGYVVAYSFTGLHNGISTIWNISKAPEEVGPEEVGRKLRSRAKKSIKAVNVLSRRYFCV